MKWKSKDRHEQYSGAFPMQCLRYLNGIEGSNLTCDLLADLLQQHTQIPEMPNFAFAFVRSVDRRGISMQIEALDMLGPQENNAWRVVVLSHPDLGPRLVDSAILPSQPGNRNPSHVPIGEAMAQAPSTKVPFEIRCCPSKVKDG